MKYAGILASYAILLASAACSGPGPVATSTPSQYETPASSVDNPGASGDAVSGAVAVPATNNGGGTTNNGGGTTNNSGCFNNCTGTLSCASGDNSTTLSLQQSGGTCGGNANGQGLSFNCSGKLINTADGNQLGTWTQNGTTLRIVTSDEQGTEVTFTCTP